MDDGGGEWPVKGKLVSSHCELHSVHLFIMGKNVTYDMAICDLGGTSYL